jgi:plasmid stabilization system protein ParE
MEMKVSWTPQSERQLKSIFEYYRDEVNLGVANRLVKTLIDATSVLRTQPQLGQVEELLDTFSHEFRYLKSGNYKIIYWINMDRNQIEINVVFDARQNPIKLDRNR